jgi:hypothetical protein
MGSTSELIPLDCTVLLLRALRAASWVDNLHEAFLLRSEEIKTGLSVSHSCSIAECRNTLKKSYGVVSLHTGRVRLLGLDVLQDEAMHANVTGLPYKEDNPAEAERFATLLAKQARFAEKGLKKRAE